LVISANTVPITWPAASTIGPPELPGFTRPRSELTSRTVELP
jgi:hypothetical protein